MATSTDLQGLKEQWKADPIWDIYETEGFEEHREELKAYQKEWEEIWESGRIERLEEKAAKMGIPDNLDLAKYIGHLEYTVQKLQDDLEAFKERV